MNNNKIRKGINLVCAINDDFVLPFAVMLYSLLSNSGRKYEINFFIIDSGVSKENRGKFDYLSN